MRSGRAPQFQLAAIVFGLLLPWNNWYVGGNSLTPCRADNGHLQPSRAVTSAPLPNTDAAWRRVVEEIPRQVDRMTLVSLESTPMPTRADISGVDGLDLPMTRQLTDDERNRVLDLMKEQSVDCASPTKETPICHNPEYELSYQHGSLEVLKVSFSWTCHSIFLYGAEPARCTFREEKGPDQSMQIRLVLTE